MKEQHTVHRSSNSSLVQAFPGGAVILVASKYFVELRLIACVAAIYGQDCRSIETQSQMLWALMPRGEGASPDNCSNNTMGGLEMLASVRKTVARALVGQILRQVGLGQVRTVGAAFSMCGRLWQKQYDAETVEKSVTEGVIRSAERIFNPNWY
jgi:hypothetical protein